MLNVIKKLTNTYLDYPDNHSVAVEVFIMGCLHKCEGCHSPEFSDLNYAENTHKVSINYLLETISDLALRSHTNKVVIMGGDPLHPKNISKVSQLCEALKDKGFDICIYTGYTRDEVLGFNFKNFDFMKCGVFDKNFMQLSYKTDDYLQLASTNQCIINNNYDILSLNGKYYFKSGVLA